MCVYWKLISSVINTNLSPLCVCVCTLHQSFKNLVAKKKRLVVLFSHWLLHAYGIISISRLDNLQQDLPLLALVPCPALFYIATAKFTEPSRILSEGGNGHWAAFTRIWLKWIFTDCYSRMFQLLLQQ